MPTLRAPESIRLRILIAAIISIPAHPTVTAQCPLPGGETIEACGQLDSIGAFGCPVFRSADGGAYRLADRGAFVDGDRVFVRGTLSQTFANCFGTPIAPRRFECNTIERCFAECGTLVDPDASGCLRFETAQNEVFAIQNTGDFLAGDRVFVTGRVDATPVPCAGQTLPLLMNDRIDACVEAIGRIASDAAACVHFLATDGTAYDLENFGGFASGDFVSVEGARDAGCVGVCGLPCLAANSIAAAYGGAGVLTETDECGLVFEAENTGQRKTRYVLDSTGGFAAGDRVFVVGAIDRRDCACTETDVLERDGCMRVEAIGSVYSACGTVDIHGVGCPTFRPDGGGVPILMEYFDPAAVHPQSGKTFVWGIESSGSPFCGDTPALRYNFAAMCLEGCGAFGQGFECNPLLASSIKLRSGVLGADTLWVENRLDLSLVDARHPAVAFVRGGYDGGPSVVLCGFPSLKGNQISPCAPSPDLNGDDALTPADIATFVSLLLRVELAPAGVEASMRADFNQDYRIDSDDVQGFLAAYLGG